MELQRKGSKQTIVEHGEGGGGKDTLCGCGPCKPSCLQKLANPKMFVFNAFFVGFLLTSMASYLGGIIPILERRFHLSSSQSGTLATINDIAILVVIVFVSYFGHNSHRPRLLAGGAFILGVGTLMCAIPHFTSDPLDPLAVLSGSSGRFGQLNILCTPWRNTNGTNGQCQKEASGFSSVAWIIVGQTVAGFGAAPFFPLVATYIEDSVGKKRTLSYMAVVYISYGFGPLLGFLLSSVSSSRYVDFNRIDADDIPNIPQNDPRWIGAWWLGFIILGIPMLFASIPLFFYPRVMPREINTNDIHDKDLAKDDNTKQSEETDIRALIKTGSKEGGFIGIIKGICFAMKRILTNFTLVALCIGVSCDTAVISGVGSFLVKYLISQFGISLSKAAICVGVIIPANIFSHVIAAAIIRRYKFNTKQCARMVVIIKASVFIGFPFFMFIAGCKNPPIAGVTVPYPSHGSDSSISAPTMVPLCNDDCTCAEEVFRPVCGSDGITYTSPCRAGCTYTNTTLVENKPTPIYMGCSCTNAIQGKSTTTDNMQPNTAEAYAMGGQCDRNCKMLPLYMIVAFVTIFLSAMITQPLLYVTLRVVKEEDRSLALAFKNFATKCLGFLPAPVYFGALINSTCLLWRYQCGERGNCWIYDIVKLRYGLHGLLFALRIISLVIFVVVYVSIKQIPEEEETNVSGEEKKKTDAVS